MTATLQPIYLLADSQLLFLDHGRPPLRVRLREHLPDSPSAAYLGASNGDEPVFFELFEAAMDRLGVSDRRHVTAAYDAGQREFLEDADLVVLGGGDVERGWRVFERTGIRDLIARRYFEGLVLVGISAGAVQLGWAGLGGEDPAAGKPVETWKLVPALIDAHDEQHDWRRLRRLQSASKLGIRGLGIPAGGGVVYHPDGTMEPLRFPVVELLEEEGRERQSLLMPPGEDTAEIPS